MGFSSLHQTQLLSTDFQADPADLHFPSSTHSLSAAPYDKKTRQKSSVGSHRHKCLCVRQHNINTDRNKRVCVRKHNITACLHEKSLLRLDLFDIASLLQSSTTLSEGTQIHAFLVQCGLEEDTYLGNLLLSMYKKHGCIADAHAVFNAIRCPSVVSWTAMIAAYAKEANLLQAVQLFLNMDLQGIKPDKVTFVCILGACNQPKYIMLARFLHLCIIERNFDSDVVIGNALITMYDKCGALPDAVSVFGGIPNHDIISWNAIITAFANHGNGKRALELFDEVQQRGLMPDMVTCINVLGACSNVEDLMHGAALHAQIINWGYELDEVVGNSLVNMYGRCKALNEAWFVFNNIQHRGVVSWTGMIEVLSEFGHAQEAFHLLQEMQKQGVRPNRVTFLSALGACSEPAALGYGRAIHAYICSSSFAADITVGNALIHMYNKCGSVIEALSIFKQMHQHDTVSWSTMIATYADHGYGREALKVFQEMQQCGIEPNSVTFLGILLACCRSGLIEQGHFFFSSMTNEYGISPSLEHYSCMIDLLGRAGRLREAEDMIKEMPMQPDAQLWSTLLGACNLHGDIERGLRVAQFLLDLDPRDTGACVLLSNIYGDFRNWGIADKFEHQNATITLADSMAGA